LSIPSIVLGLRPAPGRGPPRPGPNFANLSANLKISFVIHHRGRYHPVRNRNTARSRFCVPIRRPAAYPLQQYKNVV